MKIDVYVINLARDRERMDAMSARLTSLSIPFERFEAVLGLDMPEWVRPYFLNAQGDIISTLLRGEIGCYASHLVLLSRIAASANPALVLEDDVDLPDDLSELLNATDRLPVGWDIIRLSSPYKRGYVALSRLTSRYGIVRFKNISGSTAAYLITPRGARKFVDWKMLRTLPIDQDLRRAWDCKLETYGVFPRPVTPDITQSSIDAVNERRRLYRRSFVLSDEIAKAKYYIRTVGLGSWLSSLFYHGGMSRD
jgi:glycosyl transferase family 25